MKTDKNIRNSPKSRSGLMKTIDGLLTLNNEKLMSPNFWFTIILIYVSVVNFLILKTTPEVIFLQYAIIVLIFLRVRTKEYAKTWIPFIAFFLLYEFIRGYVDDLSPFKETTLFWMYNLEVKIFGILPSKIFQDLFAGNKLIVDISLLFYSIFFYYSFLIAFLLWLKRPKDFQTYFRKFLLLSFFGLVFFFLVPTAPPWMVNNIKNIGIERIVYGETILKDFNVFSLYQYFIYGNSVAALPSLHVAWPAFSSLFLIKETKTKLALLLLIIPLMISFSVVLTGEHYVVDVIAGFLLAYVINKFSFKGDAHLRNHTSAK